MERWPPLRRAAIVLNFSSRRLRAAGLQIQRLSLAVLVTEVPSLADLRTGKSEARLGNQKFPLYRGERRFFLYYFPKRPPSCPCWHPRAPPTTGWAAVHP